MIAQASRSMLHKRTGQSAVTLQPDLDTQAMELPYMSENKLPDIEYLRQRLRYEPDTGKLFWRETELRNAAWNKRYANREAFTSFDRHGYRQSNMGGKVMRAHRVAWALHNGVWPAADIDHINHERADNRMANLRDASRGENRKNASKPRNNTSGACGVSWDAAGSKWQAYVTEGRVQRSLGRFANFDEAVAARRAAERKFGFHANHGIDAIIQPVSRTAPHA